MEVWNNGHLQACCPVSMLLTAVQEIIQKPSISNKHGTDIKLHYLIAFPWIEWVLNNKEPLGGTAPVFTQPLNPMKRHLSVHILRFHKADRGGF